jgi:hypothetical protein
MSNTFDIGIIGAGVAGAFASLKLAKNYKCSTVVFDIGRPPMKRRRQLEGWLGCLPNSDGKFYLNDLIQAKKIVDHESIDNSYEEVKKIIKNVNNFSIIKDKKPLGVVEKRIVKNGYSFELNDFVQVFPKEIHNLSKKFVDDLDEKNHMKFVFDEEISSVTKENGMFLILIDDKQYFCKKLLISVGRSGWRWASELYKNFGIVEDNSVAKFGVRLEMDSSILKDFNKSNLTMRKENIEVGPFSWNGTVIPEDHVNMAISAFRSNENRWKTDKVSFNLIGAIPCENGSEQIDRIGQLSFIVTQERIVKERVTSLINHKSTVSIIPEYRWIGNWIEDLNLVIPELKEKAYYHAPTILPMTPRINIKSNLETNIDGLFVAGESAGLYGLLNATVTGNAVVDFMMK